MHLISQFLEAMYRYAASDSRAVLSQLNSLDRSRPAWLRFLRRFESEAIRSMASAISSTRYGSTNRAAPAVISGMAEMFEAISGVPLCIASSKTNPKLSHNDGWTTPE